MKPRQEGLGTRAWLMGAAHQRTRWSGRVAALTLRAVPRAKGGWCLLLSGQGSCRVGSKSFKNGETG